MTDITVTVLIICDSPDTADNYGHLLSDRNGPQFIIKKYGPRDIKTSLSSPQDVDCIVIDTENASALGDAVSFSTAHSVPILRISDNNETGNRFPDSKSLTNVKKKELTGPLLSVSLQYALLKNEYMQKKNKQEEQLRKLSQAVEQSPATVVITDTKGNIEYVNPKFTNLTGYSFEEAIGNNPRILKSGRQNADFYSDMWKTISNGSLWRGEFHNMKKNGDLYWESASISPIVDENGRITHYIAVKEDITARKEAEDALRISEEKLRARNLQYEKDLKIAQLAQTGLLQAEIPEDPVIGIEYRYYPLDKVGGDYFSFFHRGPGEMGIFICDVAGHGIAAALFTALIKSTSERTFRKHADEPVQYIQRLNRELKDHLSNYFITGIYGILKADAEGNATLTFTNGGHPLPVLFDHERRISTIGKSNTVIGILDEPVFEDQTVRLAKGDRIFLYTDGIPETTNSEKEIIGFDKNLLDMFSRSQSITLKETLDKILDEVNGFRGDSPSSDDISIIGLEIR